MLKYYVPPIFKGISSLCAAVSERDAGVSRGFFQSLNLGLHVGDDPLAVNENRRRFFEALNLDYAQSVCCEQVHSNTVKVVTAKDCGKGAKNLENVIKGVDGLITAEEDVPLLLFFADCAPLFLYDAQNKVIALLHAGWRGTYGDIAGNALAAMQKHFGTRPSDCLAAIGPCIGGECYSVSDDFLTQMKSRFGSFDNFYGDAATSILFRAQGKLHFSLYQANLALLQKHGLKKECIGGLPPCTACFNDSYFSYRAEHGKTGRHGAIFCLRPKRH